MSIFDQRHQKVNYQYNVNGTINFGSAHNRVDVIDEIKKLQSEVSKAVEGGALDSEKSIDIDTAINKAIIQAQKPEPSKKSIIDFLNVAKDLLGNAVAVAGLVKGVSEAIEVVRKLF